MLRQQDGPGKGAGHQAVSLARGWQGRSMWVPQHMAAQHPRCQEQRKQDGDQLPEHLLDSCPSHRRTGAPGGLLPWLGALAAAPGSPGFLLVRSTQVNFPSSGHEGPGPPVLGCSALCLQGVCASMPWAELPPILIILQPSSHLSSPLGSSLPARSSTGQQAHGANTSGRGGGGWKTKR